MLTKTIKYKDYFDVEREESFFFNLSKAELMDMSADDSFVRMISKIVAANDKKEIYDLFKQFVAKSYGVISEDGRRFDKDPKWFKEFSQTEAYVKLMDELSTNDVAAAEFINNLLPKELRDKAIAAQAAANK